MSQLGLSLTAVRCCAWAMTTMARLLGLLVALSLPLGSQAWAGDRPQAVARPPLSSAAFAGEAWTGCAQPKQAAAGLLDSHACRVWPEAVADSIATPNAVFPADPWSAVAGDEGLVDVPCLIVEGVNDKCERWTLRYHDSHKYHATQADLAAEMVVNATGTKVFTTGTTEIDGLYMMTTVSFNARTRAVGWVAHGQLNPFTVGHALALSPNDKILYVAGTRTIRPDINSDPTTYTIAKAYSARTGKTLWETTFEEGIASDLVVSPDGARIFVVGRQPFFYVRNGTVTQASRYFVVAFSARTGRKQWAQTYSGIDGGSNGAVAVAIDPTGDKVFVTGHSEHPTRKVTEESDYATLAYSAVTGRRLWLSRYRNKGINIPIALAVSPQGNRVAVTGLAQYGGADTIPLFEYGTVAYSTRTGKRQWDAHYIRSRGGQSVASALVVSRDRVFVSGTSERFEDTPAGSASFFEPVTLSYSATTGKKRWVSAVDLPGHAYGGLPPGTTDIVLDGGRLFAGILIGPYNPGDGATPTYSALIAYDATSGKRKWIARHDFRQSPELAESSPVKPVFVATSPRGRLVFQATLVDPLAQFAEERDRGVDLMLIAYKK